jgi:hypothetical protein
MIRIASLRTLVSFCGVALGVLLMYSTALPMIAEGSDAVAGWIPCHTGDPCLSNMTLQCSGGTPGYGVTRCNGASFPGVRAGSGGHVWVDTGHSANCSISGGLDQANCANIYWSYCLPG